MWREGCLSIIVQLYPRLSLTSAPLLISTTIVSAFRRMTRRTFYVLSKTNEEWSKDRYRTENDNEPHFGQDPGIELGDRICQIFSLGDGGNRNRLVNSGNSCTVKLNN